jgi:hypothetical protein
VKPSNRRENRRDRRLRMNQTGKRKVVVIIRERGGKSLPGVFRSEAEALTFIRTRIAPKTTLYADEGYPSDGRRREHQFHRRDGSYGMQDPVRFNSV